MFWRNARDAALLTRLVESSKYLFQIRHSSDKISRRTRIIKLKKEECLLFGKILETKKEKLRRLKLEAKGKIPKSTPSNVHSEFTWARESAKLTVLKVQTQKQGNKDIKTDVKQIQSNRDADAPEHKENIETNSSTVKVLPITYKAQNIKPESVQSNKPLLPKPMVKHLLEFPIFESEKSTNDAVVESSSIIHFSPMDEKSCLKYPSVTKILTATMTEEAKAVLEKWKIRMVEKLGLRGFELYQAELLNDGKLLHSTIMNHLTQKPYDVPNRIKQSFLSLDDVLKKVESVRALESHVIHRRLLYRGVVDCVAVHRGDLCLIDWKKSDKVKDTIGSTYDAPLQLASYIGALNSDTNYPFQIKKGMIVVAYTNGEPAKIHEVSEKSLEFYWKLWLQRLQDYHISLNPSQ